MGYLNQEQRNQAFKEAMTKIDLLVNQDRFSSYFGICRMLDRYCAYKAYDEETKGLLQKELHDRLIDWPKFSGNPSFPIPNPKGNNHILDAQNAYFEANNQWDINTEYGRLRREAVKWLMSLN